MNLGTIAQLPLPSDTASVSLQLSSLEVRGGSEPQGLYSGEQWGGGGSTFLYWALAFAFAR